jgi:hypothetical protein
MRYKPKNIAALQVALGGLPDKMRVEVDADIGGVSKDCRRTSEGDGVGREFGDNNSAGTRSRKCSKGEQGRCSNARIAETVGLRKTVTAHPQGGKNAERS